MFQLDLSYTIGSLIWVTCHVMNWEMLRELHALGHQYPSPIIYMQPLATAIQSQAMCGSLRLPPKTNNLSYMYNQATQDHQLMLELGSLTLFVMWFIDRSQPSNAKLYVGLFTQHLRQKTYRTCMIKPPSTTSPMLEVVS